MLSENSFSMLEDDEKDKDDMSENRSEINAGLVIEDDKGQNIDRMNWR